MNSETIDTNGNGANGSWLRIAIPNKGSLADGTAQMLREAGYRQRDDSKELVCVDERAHVEFYYLRPRDIAVYVGEGLLDAGVTGRDMLLDSRAPATELMTLGFAHSQFQFAGPRDGVRTVEDLEGKRVATSYPGLVESHLAERGISARLIKLDGAVETAIRLGVADAIADVVETGTTMRHLGLTVFGEPLMSSEAILIRRASDAPASDRLDTLLRRLGGVLVARNYVMMDYDIVAERVKEASAVTPGLEAPTISPLAKEGWCAVRAMVPRDEAQMIMDELWELGARAILVTDISACRL